MKKYSLDINGKELLIEFKNLAEQANGSALIRYGDTLLLATAVMEKNENQDLGFFPLMVDYEEKYYAAGKIRGARYIRREGRPSDEAVLSARMIDRSVRPRFPEGFKKGVQIVLTCLAWDAENDPDIMGLIGASISLSVSNIPWDGPISAVRVARIDNQLIINPSYEQRQTSELDLILAGGYNEDKTEILINMAEGNCSEVSEETIMEVLEFAKPYLKKICDFQEKIKNEIGHKKTLFEKENYPEIDKQIKEIFKNKLENALFIKDKTERNEKIDEIKKELSYFAQENYPEKESYIFNLLEKEIDDLVHENIIKNEKRIDGRKLDEIRNIQIEASILPRTHGSGLFSRGQTRSLSILTLGAPGDQQILEGMEIVGTKRFLHHYNFPPYSVGEVRPLRGPARRDIGHGMLAEKALLPLIPAFEEFPYTIRVVSEILSSNGSSSMAAITSSSMALMDAGVPIKRPATGIAIGLIKNKENNNFKILADIQGPEDHHGDMDFKVAGTKEGITAIQMDVKVDGINSEIFKQALLLGKKVRHQILNEMEKVLPEHRPCLSPYAPKILTLQIDTEKIREVIGPGGKIINEIIAETGVMIDIQQTGLIFITSETEDAAQKAMDWIKNLTKEVQVGEMFEGKVKRILDFGAFVEILPGQEGLVHISKLVPGKRVNKVEDVVKVGDVIPVKVIEIDNQGRINLTSTKKENSNKL